MNTNSSIKISICIPKRSSIPVPRTHNHVSKIVSNSSKIPFHPIDAFTIKHQLPHNSYLISVKGKSKDGTAVQSEQWFLPPAPTTPCRILYMKQQWQQLHRYHLWNSNSLLSIISLRNATSLPRTAFDLRSWPSSNIPPRHVFVKYSRNGFVLTWDTFRRSS